MTIFYYLIANKKAVISHTDIVPMWVIARLKSKPTSLSPDQFKAIILNDSRGLQVFQGTSRSNN